MAILSQPSLFRWNDVDQLGDLERLKLVIDTMPDEELMRTLERERGKHGRDDYPVRAVWNSILAGIVYQHPSMQSLRRELQRNAQLRELCGFNPLQGLHAVPLKDVYRRFLQKLMKHQEVLDKMLDTLVSRLKELLPRFGEELAFDSKAIPSLTSKRSSKSATDCRGDSDADWGMMSYKGTRADGSMWEKFKSWFGYKLHLIVDVKYELPVAYELRKASSSDAPVMREMFETLADKDPGLLASCQYAMGDKGYDDTVLITQLFNQYAIKPVIDIRNCWQDSDKSRVFPKRLTNNLTHDYKGTIYCHCPETGTVRQMVYAGFEADRRKLKYRCPAKEYGIECPGSSQCSLRSGVRISLDENPRYFTPLPRSTHKWKRLYNKRTSVERVNSRLDVSFGFERHYIRGQAKMKMRCGIALLVMLSMAVGRVQQNQEHLMRSMVLTA